MPHTNDLGGGALAEELLPATGSVSRPASPGAARSSDRFSGAVFGVPQARPLLGPAVAGYQDSALRRITREFSKGLHEIDRDHSLGTDYTVGPGQHPNYPLIKPDRDNANVP